MISGTYSFTTEIGLTEEGREFFEGLARLPAATPIATGHHGNTSTASLLTLARRVEYGGRKGRRARRRANSGVWGPTPVTIEIEDGTHAERGSVWAPVSHH